MLTVSGASFMNMYNSSFNNQRIRQILRRVSLIRTRIRRKTRIRSRRSHAYQRSHEGVSMTGRLRATYAISLHHLMRQYIRANRHDRMSSKIPAGVLPSFKSPVSHNSNTNKTRR